MPRFYVYLLWCPADGRTYTGYTAHLRRRFRQHNAPDNEGYTRGRRWHLLAVKCFLDRHSALLYERQLKRSRYDKRSWINGLGRLRVLRGRYGVRVQRHAT